MKRTVISICLILVGMISSCWISMSLSNQQPDPLPASEPVLAPEPEVEIIETITLASAGD